MSDTNALRQRIAGELLLRPENLVAFKGLPTLTFARAINHEINSAIRHYESTRFRWNETRESEFATTVSGTRVYSLPASLVRLDTLKVIYSTSYIPIHLRTWEEIEERDRRVTAADGVPTTAALYGNILRLYPVPNGAYTLVGSYIFRVRPTSLTASYCAIIAMGGGSLTATSTASHNNRLDGWTTDGEELVRARALAGVEINYLKNERALVEMGMLAQAREPYLSVREQQAFTRLADEAQDFGAPGLIRPYNI